MTEQHPRRVDFPSDVTYWAACMDALAAAHPAEWARAAAWRRLSAVDTPEATVARMRELLALERPFTDAEDVEWEALCEAYRSKKVVRR